MWANHSIIRRIVTNSVKYCLFDTPMGLLQNIDPVFSKKQIATDNFMYNSKIAYDTTTSSEIIRWLNNGVDYITYDSDAHYTTAINVYNAVKKKLNERYYGVNYKVLKSFKSGEKAFHKNRQIYSTIRMHLHKIGISMSKDFEINIKGNVPKITECAPYITKKLKVFNESMRKPHYFISIPKLQSYVSATNWKAEGITISSLEGKKIYPFYGVWSPTTHTYLNLFERYLKYTRQFDAKEVGLDIGCGTGVLGIMLHQYCNLKKMYAIDRSEEALECTKYNYAKHNAEGLSPVLFDFVKEWRALTQYPKEKSKNPMQAMAHSEFYNPIPLLTSKQ